MKALVFVILIIAIVSATAWRLRKARAAAELARRKDLERRKQRDKAALAQDIEMIWPVIIRPVKGDAPSSADARVEEPSMTAIEYAPPDRAA
jgi:hypothetical protein